MANNCGLAALSVLCACGTAAGIAAKSAGADTSPHAGMMRYPDISKDSIVFVYANDLWIAPRAGGLARPLASPAGVEMMPRFSADGKTVAFVGNYDGNQDIYTMPVEVSSEGNLPTRVTHHPASEVLCDWAPDGRLVFFSNGWAGLQRQVQLRMVPPAGGLPEKLPVPYGAFGTISPNGEWLAYVPHTTDFRTWKRYRGGMATDIWLFNLKDKSSRRATTFDGTDSQPMWVPGGDGKTLYYLSDAGPEHRLNIWAYEVAGGKSTQVTKHAEYDVKWPSIGPGVDGKGEIIFQLGPELRILNLSTKADAAVTVTIPGDRTKIRPRTVDAAKNISASSISPSGKRVLISGRGDVWSAPVKEGSPRNMTRTDGVFERDPSWSPDGKWIAYLSDESGEYELYIRPSDARPAEKKDEKKEEGAKGEEKKEGEEKADEQPAATPPAGDAAQEGAKEEAKEEVKEEAKNEAPVIASRAAPSQPRKLTNLGVGFRFGPAWSPDSKFITFTDDAGALWLTTVESGETKQIDQDPWQGGPTPSWSKDSAWFAYAKSDNDNAQGVIWLHNVKDGKATAVTTPMFNCGSPAFDRKGEFLYFTSTRAFSQPIYSDVDTSFVYTGSQELFLVPLNKDVKNPFSPKSDEEELKKDDKKADKKDEKKDEAKNGEKKNGDKPADGEKKEEAKADDGVSGTWEGSATGQELPPGGLPFTLKITVKADGTISGTVSSAMGSGGVSGTYSKDSGEVVLNINMGEEQATFKGTLKNGEGSGTWEGGGSSGEWKLSRKSGDVGGNGDKDESKGEDKKDDKPVVIELEGFEARAIPLPVSRGAFGALAVSNDNKLIYTRFPARGSSEGASIKIFDVNADEKEEKTVTAGGDFELSADGKKILVRSGSPQVGDASAGAKMAGVVTAGMMARIEPRAEWKQIFLETWRLQRDYFYEPTLHNVDWPKLRDQYMAMIEDCVSREDVAYVQAELVSELNIGHAYITSPGDVESTPSVGVGMLGADYELVKGDAGAVYRITKIYEGGPWDSDARGPLSQPGVDAKVGDYVLAVNGEPIDTTRDVYAAFINTSNRNTTVTVGPNPTIDEKSRDVVVKPLGSEASLRFRAWVEANRQYVDKRSKGQIGYIYVPNTGVDGQNELFRQFFGQRHKAALIIDDRWNGGGQIPTRFIELLNRPVTNYWARRHGNDWPWPPDAHFGPKCMLINGLAGSGGDAFPHYFRYMGLGKLIGTRTWGGLVGISGNPGLIDGGSISVPTFGFYKPTGQWAIEGHGVDPDVEVIDDPAKMQDGADPQLDAAIANLTVEIKTNPYVKPNRPASPDRRGMGIPPEQR